MNFPDVLVCLDVFVMMYLCVCGCICHDIFVYGDVFVMMYLCI